MDERTARTIQGLKDWKQIARMVANSKSSGRLTLEIEQALHERALALAHDEIAKVTELKLVGLTPAEEKVLRAVKEYLVIKRRIGSNANRTLDQIRRQGFLGAAEISVEKARPTQGFRELVEVNRQDISYENIVVQHQEEFSERTLWFAQRALGLSKSSDVVPAAASSLTQMRTEAVLHWLQGLAEENHGILPDFSNADVASAIGLDLHRYGRPQGNIQSRIDFACFQCGLPPLGLAATEPFSEAWRNNNGAWDFPISSMRVAAKSRNWSVDDFQRVLAATRTLQSSAHPMWKEKMVTAEGDVRAWAFSFDQHITEQAEHLSVSRPPSWSRDELILALELYLRNPDSTLGKKSPEVLELSELLNRLGLALGIARSNAFRNANGVYMKMMNYRRLDPRYTNHGRIGLTRGNKDEDVVWSEFSGDPQKLKAVAGAIRAVLDKRAKNDGLGFVEDEEGITEAAEGRLLTRLHRIRERSHQLVKQRKKSALEAHGHLFCEACGFDFGRSYGDSAGSIIDCHHTKPVHTLAEGEKTRLKDLALLCANCHRVVHAFRPWLSIEELRHRLAAAHVASPG